MNDYFRSEKKTHKFLFEIPKLKFDNNKLKHVQIYFTMTELRTLGKFYVLLKNDTTYNNTLRNSENMKSNKTKKKTDFYQRHNMNSLEAKEYIT